MKTIDLRVYLSKPRGRPTKQIDASGWHRLDGEKIVPIDEDREEGAGK